MKNLLSKPLHWMLGVGAVTALSVWSTARHTPLEASSHREAPMIADDPMADNTDVYAFVSPNDPNKVVLIADYIPFQLPQGGPNYYTFGENIRYEVHVKNKSTTPGDDITYRFTFTRINQDPTTFFAVRLGAQNLKTTYTCEKSTDGGTTFSTIVTNGVVPVYNIGPRSINGAAGLKSTVPYADLRQSAVTTASTGEQVFCGPSDDPFFVDLGATFDLAGFRINQGARDGLSKYNVHSIALSIPITSLQKSGLGLPAAGGILDGNYVIGVWASASRPTMRTLSAAGGPTGVNAEYVQVSRLGMPLTNEVINPIGKKDAWNRTTPYAEDPITDGYLSNPELGLYMADDVPVAPAAPKANGQTFYGEAVPALNALRIQTKSLAGQPALGGAGFPGFDFRNQAAGLSGLANNMALDNTALASKAKGGFGEYLLVAGNPRSVDIKPIFHTGVPNLIPYQLATGKAGNPLAAIGLWYDDYTPTSTSPVTPRLKGVLNFATGVEHNDLPFSTTFPYVAAPWEGFAVKR